MGEFGDRFRKERDRKGISLDDVSNVTKIGSRMLQAIEEERFDQLPGGVFNKGFIRAYAKHLGLNDDDAVAQYLACLQKAQIDAQASWQPPARTAEPIRRAPDAQVAKDVTTAPALSPPLQTPPLRREPPEMQLPRAEHIRRPRPNFTNRGVGEIPWRIVAVTAVVAVLAAILWSRHSRSSQPQTSMTAPAATSGSTTAGTTASAPPAKPNPQGVSGAPPAASGPSPDEHGKETSVGARPATSKSNPKPVAQMTLVIRASENSWISVSADGQLASQETLIAPAHTSVRATREVVVKVGNAAAISFLFNGEEIPPQGGESEAKTIVFDTSGLKTDQAPPATVN